MKDKNYTVNKYHSGGVIWITGYSSAGKTSVGRSLVQLLNDNNYNAILIDGDELRSMFSNRWGYSREEREDLSLIYFRLCSYLSKQGLTVVISAVSMYSDIRLWMKENIPNALEVYLQVPENIRRERDAATKGIYSNLPNADNIYDEPDKPDLLFDNYGDLTPEHVAVDVLSEYSRFITAQGSVEPDYGRSNHWQKYYLKSSVPSNPSPFAEYVANQIKPSSRIIDIGCGNGRDTAFFRKSGHHVTGLDFCKTAIDVCNKNYFSLGARFLHGTLDELLEDFDNTFEVIYSRFVIHAMTLQEELSTSKGAYSVAAPNALLFIECRSIKDKLAREGEFISSRERAYGHYRRFIVLDELVSRVEDSGFSVINQIESRGLAPFDDEDPIVIRLVAQKND